MNAKIKKTITGYTVTLFLTVFMPFASVSTVHAAATSCASNTFFPAWYDGLCTIDNGSVHIKSPNELGGQGATTGAQASNATANKFGAWLTIIALNIVTMILYVVGYVSLGFTIFGGFKYMTSGDNSSGTMAARKTITNAVIGLVLSILSVAIVKFIAGAVK
jgi:hypothetical protein